MRVSVQSSGNLTYRILVPILTGHIGHVLTRGSSTVLNTQTDTDAVMGYDSTLLTLLGLAWSNHGHILKAVAITPHKAPQSITTLENKPVIPPPLRSCNTLYPPRDWVRDHLTFDNAGMVSVFETTIRVLGGLLSAFELSKDKVCTVARRSPDPIPAVHFSP